MARISRGATGWASEGQERRIRVERKASQEASQEAIQTFRDEQSAARGPSLLREFQRAEKVRAEADAQEIREAFDLLNWYRENREPLMGEMLRRALVRPVCQNTCRHIFE